MTQPHQQTSAIFAERLYELREARGWTQLELARRAFGDRSNWHSSVCLYERGKQAPGLDRLVMICRALGVSSDYMLGLTDEYKPGSPAPRWSP